MKRRSFLQLSAAMLPGMMLPRAFASYDVSGSAWQPPDELGFLFQRAAGPPPYTLWQWVNGCVTKEGITYDLEAFKKAGINDVQQFLFSSGGGASRVPDASE